MNRLQRIEAIKALMKEKFPFLSETVDARGIDEDGNKCTIQYSLSRFPSIGYEPCQGSIVTMLLDFTSRYIAYDNTGSLQLASENVTYLNDQITDTISISIERIETEIAESIFVYRVTALDDHGVELAISNVNIIKD